MIVLFTPLFCYILQNSDPPETAFSIKNKKSAGENSKNAKAFSGGAQRTLACARRWGLQLSAFFLKIGSSLVVQGHQTRNKIELVALLGGFFFGFAEQKPRIFRGGRNFWGSRRLRLFAANGGFLVK